MGIIVWILFGALVGWIASIIMGTDNDQGALLNVGVGISGALLGGFVADLIGLNGVTSFNLPSFLVALTGAILLLGILKIIFHTAK